MTELESLVQSLNGLGDSALTGFIVWVVVDFVKFLTPLAATAGAFLYIKGPLIRFIRKVQEENDHER